MQSQQCSQQMTANYISENITVFKYFLLRLVLDCTEVTRTVDNTSWDFEVIEALTLKKCRA